MSENTNPTGAAGVSQGAGQNDLSEGQGVGGAPALPVDNGNKPVIPKDAKDEIHGEDDKTKKPAPKKEDEPVVEEEPANEDKGDWHKEYVQFDNPDAQAAVDLLKEAGVSPVEANAAFEKALQSHDLNDINWAMLEAKLGPAKMRLVKNGVEKYYNDVYSAQVATVQKVHEIFGGSESWDTVKKWAQATEKKDPAFKVKLDGIRKALDAGGYAAEIGAQQLLGMYNSAPGTTGLKTKTIVQGNSTVSVSGDPLSRADYLEQYKKAYEKGDRREMDTLNKRRQLGKQMGM